MAMHAYRFHSLEADGPWTSEPFPAAERRHIVQGVIGGFLSGRPRWATDLDGTFIYGLDAKGKEMKAAPVHHATMKTSRHHAAKKSARQLEREIAAVLQGQSAAGDEHARGVLNDLIEQRGGPKRADFSGNIKRMLRELYGVKVRIRTNPTKNPFIDAWTREGESPPFPPEVRNTALDVIYGEGFERHRANPSAGNVRPFSIALHKPQWVELFRRLGHRLEEI